MKVILIKTVGGLGSAGDIKEVKDGYARNYLLPQGLARVATNEAIKEVEMARAYKEKIKVRQAKKYEDLAKKINNLKIIIKARADEKKKLFGSVNVAKIANELKNRNIDIDPKFIKLEEPIKELGHYNIDLDFGNGLTSKFGLTIAPEK